MEEYFHSDKNMLNSLCLSISFTIHSQVCFSLSPERLSFSPKLPMILHMLHFVSLAKYNLFHRIRNTYIRSP
jgi:hypothetical protein